MFFRECFSGKTFRETFFPKTTPKTVRFREQWMRRFSIQNHDATPLKIGDRGVLSPGFYHNTGNMRFAREWPFLPFTELYRFFFNPGKNIHENFFPGKHSLKRPFRSILLSILSILLISSRKPPESNVPDKTSKKKLDNESDDDSR